MATIDEIRCLAVTANAVAYMAEKHPGMTLEAASEALQILIVQAAVEATDQGTIHQQAANAYHSPQVARLLPPWE